MEDTGLILSGKEWIKRKRKEFGKHAYKFNYETVNKKSPLRGSPCLSEMLFIQDVINNLAKLKRDSKFMLEAGLDAIKEVDRMILELNKKQLGISLFYYDKVGVL